MPVKTTKPADARPNEREATVPGRSAPPPRTSSVTPAEVRATRLLVAISAAAGLAFAIVAVVGFQLIIYLVRGPAGPPGPECVEGDPSRGCQQGLYCQAGRCRPEIQSSICEAGDPCNSCECVAPMSCDAGVCAVPVAPAPVDVCDRPDIQKLLAALERDCQGDLGSCPAGSLSKFAMKYEGFNELMAGFGDTLTIHFPAGMPPLDGSDAWPDPETRERYLERLRPLAPALRDAKSVFIIARASPHGSRTQNEKFAKRRWFVARDLLYSVLEPAERDALGRKFREFILGPRLNFDRDFFTQRYGNRFVTWDRPSRDKLLDLLRKQTPIDDDDDLDWMTNTINQVVLIVPVPCELKPPPAGEGSAP
jgi:hypothetical protein